MGLEEETGISMTIDYRQRVIEFTPSIWHLIIAEEGGSKLPLVTQLYLHADVAEKFSEFGSHLVAQGQPINLIFYDNPGEKIAFYLQSKIKNFPIRIFARQHKISRILEKQIDEMDVKIKSLRVFENKHGMVSTIISRYQESKLVISSIDPNSHRLLDDEFFTMPAAVQLIDPRSLVIN
jgi:hypothetical protein